MDIIRKNWKYYVSVLGASSAFLAFLMMYKRLKSKPLPENLDKFIKNSSNLNPLLKSEALHRSSLISNINIKYTLFLNLRDKNTMNSEFDGTVLINFFMNKVDDVFLDFHGKIKAVTVNFKVIDVNDIKHKNDRLYLSADLLSSTNTVIIEFSSIYSVNEHGLRYSKSESFENYIVSNFEPFYAHTMFPCFDQPDLKAKIKLLVVVNKEFEVITSSKPNFNITHI